MVRIIALLTIALQSTAQRPVILALGDSMTRVALVWFVYERKHFKGPPQGVMIQQRSAEIKAAEKVLV